MDYPPLRALFLITTEGIPELKQQDRWSGAIQSFLRACLQKEPVDRPSAKELLKSEFLQRICNNNELVDLSVRSRQIKKSQMIH